MLIFICKPISYSVENDDDDHDQLYVLIRHGSLVNHQRHHFCSYDGDEDEAADVDADKMEFAALHIQVQKERRHHWQSADQSLLINKCKVKQTL